MSSYYIVLSEKSILHCQHKDEFLIFGSESLFPITPHVGRSVGRVGWSYIDKMTASCTYNPIGALFLWSLGFFHITIHVSSEWATANSWTQEGWAV